MRQVDKSQASEVGAGEQEKYVVKLQYLVHGWRPIHQVLCTSPHVSLGGKLSKAPCAPHKKIKINSSVSQFHIMIIVIDFQKLAMYSK